MASELLEIERDLNGCNYLIEVEVWANMVDESFSHEFGIEVSWGIEVDQVDILTVYNNNGEVITDRETIKKLEKEIDLDHFNDVEFDFSE